MAPRTTLIAEEIVQKNHVRPRRIGLRESGTHIAEWEATPRTSTTKHEHERERAIEKVEK